MVPVLGEVVCVVFGVVYYKRDERGENSVRIRWGFGEDSVRMRGVDTEEVRFKGRRENEKEEREWGSEAGRKASSRAMTFLHPGTRHPRMQQDKSSSPRRSSWTTNRRVAYLRCKAVTQLSSRCQPSVKQVLNKWQTVRVQQSLYGGHCAVLVALVVSSYRLNVSHVALMFNVFHPVLLQ